jgi:phosphoglycerate dehydrogenase-like enzyme
VVDGRPTVVALGEVAAELVEPALGDGLRFVPDPDAADLAAARGAIVRAAAIVDAPALARMPALRVLARTGVGVNLIDVDEATRRGIAVVVTPGSGTRAVAEGVIGMALSLVKRLAPLTCLVRTGRWAERSRVTVGDLDGATLGVVGYGRIGRRVGELAQAFGMDVVAHDPISPPPAGIACPDLGALAARSDVVTLHAPLTPATRHLVDDRFLARCRAGAILINCGRGALVDLDATHAALVDGRLGGVGLDVFDPEPAEHHRLFDHPNVILTPHVMGLSARATAATFTDAARGVRDILTGRQISAVPVANPAWTHAAGLELDLEV